MTTSYTPGPWGVGLETGVTSGLHERNPGYHVIVAKCPPFAFGVSLAVTERIEDANLIAAAPELLEALKGFMAFAEKNQRVDQHNPYTARELHTSLFAAGDAAIAKAEGRAS